MILKYKSIESRDATSNVTTTNCLFHVGVILCMCVCSVIYWGTYIDDFIKPLHSLSV